MLLVSCSKCEPNAKSFQDAMKPDFYLDSLKFSSKWFLKPKKVKSVSIFKYLELAKLFFFNCGQAKQDKKKQF